MIEHHCAHIQVLYMNGAVKHFLLLIGDVSKVGEKRGREKINERIWLSIRNLQKNNTLFVFLFWKITVEEEFQFMQESIRS